MDSRWIGVGLIATALAWLAQDRLGLTWLAPLLLLATGVAYLVAVRRPATA